jgi:hypothetical protein
LHNARGPPEISGIKREKFLEHALEQKAAWLELAEYEDAKDVKKPRQNTRALNGRF